MNVKGVKAVSTLTNSLLLGAEGGGGLLVGDMLFQLIMFVVLLVLLRIFAWGPIMGVMKDREDHISNEIETAEKNRKDAERMSQEAQEELKKTRQEAQQIIENAKQTAKEQEQSIIATAKSESERIKESARQEIETEKDKAVQALQDQVASLSVRIASKVIEKELTAQDQEQLINEYIKELGEEK
ncbi:F0F1 ATP synthase subunit B [Pontibacillus halophilus]|nr:F0F1 ATP synthase subunit B [Pontibacillus halophilus]